METTWQNSYSLSWQLGKPNRHGLCKVYLRFYSTGYADWLLFEKTIRVHSDDFDPDNYKAPIKSTSAAQNQNSYLNGFRVTVESRALKAPPEISKEYLLGNVASSDRITDFIEDFVDDMRKENEKAKEKTTRGVTKAKAGMSEGRLKIYEVIKGKLEKFDKKATFNRVSAEWIKRFETHIRGGDIGDNTLNSNMTVFIAILNKAKNKKLLKAEQFEGYKIPVYDEEIPTYLEEHEIDTFYEIVKTIQSQEIKTCGYYFLLACYAGYRISDLFTFNYHERVRGNKIILRASKNKKIVSIAIFPRLEEILDYCKNNPISVAKETMRKMVKLIASLAGLKSRDIKVHSGRHSFAMMMLERGLSVDEIAELLGDSIEVARRYARMTNKHLHRRVMEVMA